MKRKAALLSIMLAAGICATPAATAYAAPHIHPYNGVEAETNFGSEGVEVVTEADGRKVVSSIEKGDYFTVKTCDFSSGLATITITAKTDGMGVIDVRKGDSTGESLGNIKLKNTNGEYQTFTATLKNLEGPNETITFVGAVGNVSIDSWSATPLTETPDPGTGEEDPGTGNEDPGTGNVDPSAPVDIYTGVEAENVESSNATVATSGDVTYQTINVGGYVVVKNVDFTNGISGVFANAQAAKPKTSIAVYVDSLDSAPIATITVTSRSFKDVAAKISNDISGTHDVYLVAVGNPVDLNSFRIMANPNHTPDPVDPDPVNPDPVDPAPVVDVYAGVEAESVESSNATVQTAGDVTYQTINAGGYVVVKNVDFSQGISGVFAKAQASKPKTSIAVYVDSLDGAPIATITVTSRAFKDVAAKISNDLSGTHDIYLVAVGNPVDLDSFRVMANPNHTPDPVDPDPVDPDPVDPAPVVDVYAGVEAESVEANNATVATSGDVTYQTIDVNGYVVVKNVDLSKGISGVIAKAQASRPKTSLSIYVDSLDSAPIATITVTSRNFKDVAAKISSDLTGTHDIYLVAVGNPVDLDSFQILPAQNVNPDPVDPDPVDPDPVDPDPVDPDPVDPDPVDPPTEGKDVTYTINNWGTGYLVNFKVTNNTGSAVSGWTVKVRKDQVKIDSSWCVNITEEGDYYVITPLEWNTNLANGQSAEFGIIGTGSIGDSIEVIVQ